MVVKEELPVLGSLNREALSIQAVVMIEEKIIEGVYSPGTVLPSERELCRMLEVSRTVVREAMKSLEARGLIRIEQGRGSIVSEPDHMPSVQALSLYLKRQDIELVNLAEMRRVIEPYIAGLAAVRRTESDLEQMRETIELMRMQHDDPKGHVESDLEFHLTIARACGNPLFYTIMSVARELLMEVMIRTFRPEVSQITVQAHQRIFEAISAMNTDEASKAMIDHLSTVEMESALHKPYRS